MSMKEKVVYAKVNSTMKFSKLRILSLAQFTLCIMSLMESCQNQKVPTLLSCLNNLPSQKPLFVELWRITTSRTLLQPMKLYPAHLEFLRTKRKSLLLPQLSLSLNLLKELKEKSQCPLPPRDILLLSLNIHTRLIQAKS